MNNMMDRTPINKTAAVVVNQCNCSNEYQMNNLLDERDTLKGNVKKWIADGVGNNGKRVRARPLVKDANRRLGELNKQLKPYDEYHRRNKVGSLNDAIVLAAKDILNPETFQEIEKQAKQRYYQ